MKSRTCPYRRHCHNAGDCETCDFGKAFEKLSGKIRRLKEKNRRLTEENALLRGRIDALDDPIGASEKSTGRKYRIPPPELTEEQKKEKELVIWDGGKTYHYSYGCLLAVFPG